MIYIVVQGITIIPDTPHDVAVNLHQCLEEAPHSSKRLYHLPSQLDVLHGTQAELHDECAQAELHELGLGEEEELVGGGGLGLGEEEELVRGGGWSHNIFFR